MVNETINFRYGPKHKAKLVSFNIEHNLKDFGLDLWDAFTNWSARCDNPTDLPDFIDYIKSKDPINIIANAKQ